MTTTPKRSFQRPYTIQARYLLLHALLYGPWNQRRLQNLTGVSPATIQDTLERLQAAKHVTAASTSQGMLFAATESGRQLWYDWLTKYPDKAPMGAFMDNAELFARRLQKPRWTIDRRILHAVKDVPLAKRRLLALKPGPAKPVEAALSRLRIPGLVVKTLKPDDSEDDEYYIATGLGLAVWMKLGELQPAGSSKVDEVPRQASTPRKPRRLRA